MLFERHIVFWIATLLVFIGPLWLLSSIFLPFVVGMALAYLLDPLVSLRRYRASPLCTGNRPS